MLPIAQNKINLLLFAAVIGILFGCSKESDSNFTGDTKGPGSGKGGSMARFTIACDHLYVVDETSLYVFSIADPANPQFVKKNEIGFGIETIFPFGNYLLIGSSTGMFIYSINNCESPVQLAVFSHVLSCDPVVAEGNTAYVTLRAGGNCRVGFTENQLEIIDISVINQPNITAVHSMEEPWGLAVENQFVYICHNDKGLGIYNVSNPYNLVLRKKLPDIKSYDVILNNGVMIITGPGGIYQYDYTDLDDITLLSTIPVP